MNSRKGITLLEKRLMDALFFDWEDRADERQRQTLEWRRKRKETYAKKQFFKNLIESIVSTPGISKTRGGNPTYYPKIPHYIKSRNIPRKIGAKTNRTKEDDFVDTSVHISASPISSQDMESRLDTLMDINPDILSYSAFHGRDIDIITGFTRTMYYSYPVVTSYVGYMVGTLTDIEGEKIKLCSIYAYKDVRVLGILLDFLQSLKVDNQEDVTKTIEYLRSILLK